MLIAIPLHYFSPKLRYSKSLSETPSSAYATVWAWKMENENEKNGKKTTNERKIEREKSEIIHMKITICMPCTRVSMTVRYPFFVRRADSKMQLFAEWRENQHYADGKWYVPASYVSYISIFSVEMLYIPMYVLRSCRVELTCTNHPFILSISCRRRRDSISDFLCDKVAAATNHVQ